jgi:predicted 3-demethylubiquinone-9 3-methyltransferase (glyoxalase superfamily)
MQKARPFLMFQENNAEEAMNFYVGLFKDAKVIERTLAAAGGPGKEGSLQRGVFEFKGQAVLCYDSPIKHAFAFTPAISFFIDCDSEDEIEMLAKALSGGGTTLMPLGAYGFSRKFAWVGDRFGVTWQLNLA